MPHSEKTRQLPSLLLTFAIAIAVTGTTGIVLG